LRDSGTVFIEHLEDSLSNQFGSQIPSEAWAFSGGVNPEKTMSTSAAGSAFYGKRGVGDRHSDYKGADAKSPILYRPSAAIQ
jgi:hypothetical protein